VSKHARILDTFLVHPWSVVVCHELMALTVEELAKLVYKHHGGSKQLISAHPDKLTADQKVVCSNHAGCICLGDRHYSTKFSSRQALIKVAS
jgi:hypothetical protein